MRRMLGFVIVFCSIGGPALVGCGPSLTEKDLGEVQTEASQMPGTDKPYEIPEPRFSEEPGLDPGNP